MAKTRKLRVCTLTEYAADYWVLGVPDSTNDNLRKMVSQGIEAAQEGRLPNVSPYILPAYSDAYMDGYDMVVEAMRRGLYDCTLAVGTIG